MYVCTVHEHSHLNPPSPVTRTLFLVATFLVWICNHTHHLCGPPPSTFGGLGGGKVVECILYPIAQKEIERSEIEKSDFR